MKITLGTPLTRIILFSIFSLAYLVSPYWILVPGTVFPGMLAISTVLVAMLWSRYSAGTVSIEIGFTELFFFFLVIAMSLLWNWNALTIDLAWRGDEDDHFSYVLSLLQKTRVVFDKISGPGFLLILSTVATITVLLWLKKRLWFYVLISLFIIAVIALAYVADRYVEFDYLLRYPYINRWLHSIPVIILNAAGIEASESLYRIIPFLSTSLLAFVGFHFLRHCKPLALLASLFILTVPAIDYYATVLYLEMPAVLLFTVILLGGEKILQDAPENIKQSLPWYALLFVGFIKETVLPVLLVIAGMRSLYQLRFRSGMSVLQIVRLEISVVISILLPIAVYLSYRILLSDQRSYHMDLAQLVSPELWHILSQVIKDQMLTPAIFAVLGTVVLIIQRRLALLLLLFLSGLSMLVFFALDYSAYWGYSRFSLMYIPPLLAASLIFFRYLLDNGHKLALYLLFAAAIAVNLVQRPIDASGVRASDWGVYNEKTAEYYYPYRDTLRWLYNNARHEKILMDGAYYLYKYSFYTDLWQWQANIKQEIVEKKHVDGEMLRQSCRKAAREGYSVLVFQMTGKRLSDPPLETSCRKQKSFRYGDNELVIYFIPK